MLTPKSEVSLSLDELLRLRLEELLEAGRNPITGELKEPEKKRTKMKHH